MLVVIPHPLQRVPGAENRLSRACRGRKEAAVKPEREALARPGRHACEPPLPPGPGFPGSGAGALRSIREEYLAPGAGMPIRARHDLEVLTLVLQGGLEHRDSLGDAILLGPGDVQRLCAGSGVLESEFNVSGQEAVRYLQLLLAPDRCGLPPCCQMRHYPESDRQGRFCLVAARGGAQGALPLHSDASVHLGCLAPAEVLGHRLPAGRCGWLQVLRGRATVNGRPLTSGQGVLLAAGEALLVQGALATELLLVELAPA